MRLEFEKYKDRLFKTLLAEDYHDGFMDLVEKLHKEGHSKSDIYDLFLEFHRVIQIDPEFKNNEGAYDGLSDFIDGFTAWGKNWKILPDELDL